MLADGELSIRFFALLALALIVWAAWPTSVDRAEWHISHTIRGKMMRRRVAGAWQFRPMTREESLRDAKDEAW